MQQLTATHMAHCHAHSAASCSGRFPAACTAVASRYLGGRQRGRLALPLQAGSGPQLPHPEEGNVPPGDTGLQDSLIKQLEFEIGKQRVNEFVEAEADGLRSKAEEAKEELDKLADLQNLRAEVAFNSALADINREADEFEEQLRKSREEREASERDLEQWEDDVAVARSQGHFFQSLYQTKKKRPVGMDAKHLQERASKVQESARSDVSSWVRYYLFAFLAFVLAAEVVMDLRSDAPSAMQDVLYTLLVVLLGVTAYNERKALR